MQPFIHSLEEVSLDIGISIPILAIIINTIAPEIPEKISIMMLARKEAAGTSIPIVNVLGSKILNITLLFAVAVFVSMIYHGFTTKIPVTDILWYEMILVRAITIAALIPMLKLTKYENRYSDTCFIYSRYNSTVFLVSVIGIYLFVYNDIHQPYIDLISKY